MELTPNIEPFIIQCVHLVYFAFANDSILDEGKNQYDSDTYFFLPFLPFIDEFIPFSLVLLLFSCVRPVEWLCAGYSISSIFSNSINANDSNLIQYLVYLNRILKLALIVSGAIALLVLSTAPPSPSSPLPLNLRHSAGLQCSIFEIM